MLDTGQISLMLDFVHDTTENKTSMPNACPKIHPACGPLQTMQAFSALGHRVPVKPIMLPLYLTTRFSCSCTWAYVRRTASQHYIVKSSIVKNLPVSTCMSKSQPPPPPHPHPTRARTHTHTHTRTPIPPSNNTHKRALRKSLKKAQFVLQLHPRGIEHDNNASLHWLSLPTTTHYISIFAIRNEAHLLILGLCLNLVSFWSIETIKNTHNHWTNKESSICPQDKNVKWRKIHEEKSQYKK